MAEPGTVVDDGLERGSVELLDRPIWHALATCQAGWVRRHGRAAGFDVSLAPFVATADDSPESLADLNGLVGPGGGGALFTTEPLAFPDAVDCVQRGVLEQMVLPSRPGDLAGLPDRFGIRDLTATDSPTVRALVDLTKPGPFGARTLELGRYVGAFRDGVLVAMAGERLRLPGYVEISAVCTHPDHRGRGLARGLIAVLTQDAFGRGLVPFLHVFAENAGAVAAYRSMGFVTRRAMHLAVVKAGGVGAESDGRDGPGISRAG